MKHTLAWQKGKNVEIKYEMCIQEPLQMMYSTFHRRKYIKWHNLTLPQNSEIEVGKYYENTTSSKNIKKVHV